MDSRAIAFGMTPTTHQDSYSSRSSSTSRQDQAAESRINRNLHSISEPEVKRQRKAFDFNPSSASSPTHKRHSIDSLLGPPGPTQPQRRHMTGGVVNSSLPTLSAVASSSSSSSSRNQFGGMAGSGGSSERQNIEEALARRERERESKKQKEINGLPAFDSFGSRRASMDGTSYHPNARAPSQRSSTFPINKYSTFESNPGRDSGRYLGDQIGRRGDEAQVSRQKLSSRSTSIFDEKHQSESPRPNLVPMEVDFKDNSGLPRPMYEISPQTYSLVPLPQTSLSRYKFPADSVKFSPYPQFSRRPEAMDASSPLSIKDKLERRRGKGLEDRELDSLASAPRAGETKYSYLAETKEGNGRWSERPSPPKSKMDQSSKSDVVSTSAPTSASTSTSPAGKETNNDLANSRKMAHLLSEQRRRESINSGFQDLKNAIPECKNTVQSKASILNKAVEYISKLEQSLSSQPGGDPDQQSDPRRGSTPSTSETQNLEEIKPYRSSYNNQALKRERSPSASIPDTSSPSSHSPSS